MTIDIYKKYNIDVSKLKRDYIKFPLQKIKAKRKRKIEKPDKNDFYFLYINCNLSNKEIANYFNHNSSTIIRWVKYFNIKKPQKLSIIKKEQTCLEKYGCKNYTQTNEYKEKSKQTCLEKYGCEYSTQSEEIKEKSYQTCLEKYGYKHYSQSNEFKNRLNEINEKSYQTKKNNCSLGKNISKAEKEIFSLLKSKYPDVIQQYKSEKYPWKCDFYIPSLDLYIEYQGFVTHGKEPYIGSIEQNILVEKIKEKNTDINNKIIETWTKIDVLKREIVKKNKLNWLEFFNMNQFIDWFNKKDNIAKDRINGTLNNS